jgi:hypothetical protein
LTCRTNRAIYEADGAFVRHFGELKRFDIPEEKEKRKRRDVEKSRKTWSIDVSIGDGPGVRITAVGRCE